MHTHSHTYTHSQTYTHTHKHTLTHAHTHTDTHTYTYTLTHTHSSHSVPISPLSPLKWGLCPYKWTQTQMPRVLLLLRCEPKPWVRTDALPSSPPPFRTLCLFLSACLLSLASKDTSVSLLNCQDTNSRSSCISLVTHSSSCAP